MDQDGSVVQDGSVERISVEQQQATIRGRLLLEQTNTRGRGRGPAVVSSG